MTKRVVVTLWDGEKDIEEELDVEMPNYKHGDQDYEYVSEELSDWLVDLGYSKDVQGEMEISFKITSW